MQKSTASEVLLSVTMQNAARGNDFYRRIYHTFSRRGPQDSLACYLKFFTITSDHKITNPREPLAPYDWLLLLLLLLWCTSMLELQQQIRINTRHHLVIDRVAVTGLALCELVLQVQGKVHTLDCIRFFESPPSS